MGILRNFYLIGLFGVFINGCSYDGLRIGAGTRYADGKHRIYYEEKFVPLGRIEAYKKLNEKVEGNLRFDYVAGSFNFEDNKIQHEIHGDLESFGAGLKFYPFCENFSLDVGGEVFTVQADALAKFGLWRGELNDRVYGFGVNVGASVWVPLQENFSLFFSGDYNFTDNHSRNISFDFDGVYGFVGLEIKLK